jgi:two-component system sensor histidine kinase DegS
MTGMPQALDIKTLNNILKETVNTIDKCKEQIFDIAENARQQCEKIKKELEDVKMATSAVITEVDYWQAQDKKARLKLIDVSRNFKLYTEEDIKKAYNKAQDLQVKVMVLREKESLLRSKREGLEISYRNLAQTAEKAEQLISKFSVAMGYLTSNLQNICEEFGQLYEQQQFGMAVIQAQEEERRRIARGMHDGPAQNLANIVLTSELIEKLMACDQDKALEEIRELKLHARNTLEDVRKIIFDLRPMDLDDLGIEPTIKRYANNIGEKNGVKIEFISRENQRRYMQPIEVAVFRILQEALTNAINHADCSTIRIILETTPKNIGLIVKDDGIGFDVATCKNKGRFGLKSMYEWVRMLKGTIEISSTPNKGAGITVNIPIQEEV